MSRVSHQWQRRLASLGALVWLLLAASCIPGNMVDQPKLDPLEPSSLFADGTSARALVSGTVPQASDSGDPVINTGRSAGELVQENPLEVTEALVGRGQERYDIYCTPCHGAGGEGDGPVIQRGYAQPPSLAAAEVAEMPDGQLFEVISEGFGQMPPYDFMIPAEDRWAIVAFVRQLQQGE